MLQEINKILVQNYDNYFKEQKKLVSHNFITDILENEIESFRKSLEIWENRKINTEDAF